MTFSKIRVHIYRLLICDSSISGIYFARDAQYSTKCVFFMHIFLIWYNNSIDMENTKEMNIQSQTEITRSECYGVTVMCGDSCVGQRGMKRPPTKSNGAEYETLVNSLTDPRIFVCSHDNQARPLAVVVFKHVENNILVT